MQIEKMLVAAAALVCLSALCLDAQAKKKNVDEARDQFEEGIRLYEKDKFEEAAIAFERAYELKPSYKILYNIAQVESELEHYAAAHRAYTAYLEQGGEEISEDRKDLVGREIERLRTLFGYLTISCPVDGAKIKVDNEAVGTTPLEEAIEVDIGKHEVTVVDGAEELFSEVIKIAGGEDVALEVAVGPEDEDDDQQEAPPASEEEPKRLWTWIALGVGGAAAVAAGITGGVAASKKSDLDGDCASDGSCPESSWDTLDSSRNLATTTNALIGVAAVGVAAGVALFFLEPRLNGESERPVALAPAVTPDGAAITLGGRF